ncbi:MAG: hypothetical protein IT165_18495 [Bryobacterales bacterium]|nr:hypothetical protein [Bryobacterales bacterium]
MKNTIFSVAKVVCCFAAIIPLQAQVLLTGPNTLVFTATAGGANPAPQTIQIRHTGDTPRIITVSATTLTGSWLQVSGTTTGVTPAKVTVNAIPAGLNPGTYNGSILITSTGVPSARVDVTLTVVTAPQLTAFPNTLSFSRQLGVDPPSDDEQLLYVGSTGSAATFTVTTTTTDGSAWLLTSSNTTTTPGVISVRVNPSGLGAGPYNGSISIAAQGLATVSVPVSLTITQKPFLTANPSFLNLTALRNGAAVTQSVAIQTSSGNVPFNINATTTTGGPWLILNQGNSAPISLDVSANPAGLPLGTYTGTIVVTPLDPAIAPISIPVSFNVTDAPILSASPRFLSATISTDQTNLTQALAPIQLTATSAGANYTVSATTSNGGAWLVAGPFSGTAPDTISSLVDATGLPSGTYRGAINITGPGNAVTLPVTLVVTSRAQLVVDPPSIIFNLQKGQTQPSNQVINVTSTGAAFNFQSTVTAITPAGSAWLLGGATTGTTPAPLTLGVNLQAASALANGQYNATITFSGQPGVTPAPPASPTLSVILNVSDSALFNVSPATLDFVMPATGPIPAPRTLAVTTTDNSRQTFTATPSGGSWLLVGPSGNTPQNVTVQVAPSGLGPGVYEANIAVTVPSITATPQNVRVRLIIQPSNVIAAAPASLAFTQTSGGTAPAPKTIALTSTAAAGYQVTTSTAGGGAWLNVSPTGGSSPGALTVSVNAANLAAGIYTGSIGVASPDVNNSPLNIPVTLTITAPALNVTPLTVSLLAAPGSTQSQTAPLSVSAGGAQFTTNVSTLNGGPWLSVDPSTGTSPATVTVRANPTGLPAGAYTGTITFNATGVSNSPQTVTVTFNIATAPPPGRQLISQIADGSAWKTTITLVNLDTDPAPYTLRFYADDGSPLRLPFDGTPGRVETLSGTIPVGGSRTISTLGTDTLLSQGWAELTSTRLVSGLGVFRQRVEGRPDQEAAVSATVPSNHFVLPFDNTQSFVSSMALVNTNSTQSRAIAASPRNEDGSALLGDSVNLPPLGHNAFVMSERFPSMAGLRGSVDFASPSADFSALGLRFNPGGAFTSLPTLNVPLNSSGQSTTQIISQIADGSAWKTTITLVNLDTAPAPFTLRFWRQNGSNLPIPLAGGGSADSIDGTIPVGGIRVIETLGGATDLVQGWAELTTTRNIGGLAVFRQRVTGRPDQEAAVTLTTTSNKFVLPFDNTDNFVTSMALVNVSATLGTTINVVIRDESGQQIGTDTISLSGRGHTAFTLPGRFAPSVNRRGTVEFTSTGTQITGLGLRFNPGGAFTSFPVSPK